MNHARLSLVTFFRLNLCETGVEWVDFDRVTFFECDHRGKSYAGQRLVACQFTDNQLDDVDFSRATLRQSNFKGASLRRANLTGVQAQQSLWLEANLTHAQCRSGQFDQAIFSEATLDAANFSRAPVSMRVPTQPRGTL